LGNIYRQKEMYDEAIAQYQAALKVTPQSNAAKSSLALTYELVGKREDAIKEYQQLIAQMPQNPPPSAAVIYNQLAWLYAEDSNNLSEALSFAQKANEIAPRSGAILDTLGWVHFKQGNYKEAIDKFKVAVVFTPDQPTIHYHLGMAYYKTDQKKEALKELKKALVIQPDFPEASSAREVIDQLTNPH
jgi:tetratricopeptide (TPR) repeat protein